MENTISRILIETTIRQTLKGLRENPKRSIRNLVDMALQFSEGRFQSRFFSTAQTMLENENSSYYALIEDAAKHIETEHLVKFGMNLGYNSCILGARQIRSNEARLGFNIPWAVMLEIAPSLSQDRLARYEQSICEGENLGIYSWMLLTHADPAPVLPLIEKHSDCAMFLFCRPQALTNSFLQQAAQLRHLMLVIRYEDAAARTCAALREAELPYSIYCPYGQEDSEAMINGTLFSQSQLLHPIFTVLVPKPGCSAQLCRTAHQAAAEARNKQCYQTVPWELYHDTRSLDEIISENACCVLLDKDGNLYAPDNLEATACGNLFAEGLTSLIKRAYPK